MARYLIPVVFFYKTEPSKMFLLYGKTEWLAVFVNHDPHSSEPNTLSRERQELENCQLDRVLQDSHILSVRGQSAVGI